MAEVQDGHRLRANCGCCHRHDWGGHRYRSFRDKRPWVHVSRSAGGHGRGREPDHYHETAHDLDVHVVLDNLSAHKAPKITDWLAHPKRAVPLSPCAARWHLHFTPTSSSWLNLVEGWFNLLTERRLRRGTFSM